MRGARLLQLAVLLGSFVACQRQDDKATAIATTPATPTADLRTRAAAITVRFHHGRSAPDSLDQGHDRLQVAAVFADVDRRDAGLVAGLASQAGPGGAIEGLDQCVRQPEGTRPLGATTATRPQAWVQLLDVGNVELASRDQRWPLRIQLVPAVVEAARGVRYDLSLDNARMMLAASPLVLRATGGDGVAGFEARVEVPRPVRLTHVGAVAVRQGVAEGVPLDGDLPLRWGSVDGHAELEMRIGSEEPGTLGWLRCRLHDDGAFAVPQSLLATLPTRSVHRPWLVVLVRKTKAAVPGFDGQPLQLELTDSVHVY
jgi:hypothetical protein